MKAKLFYTSVHISGMAFDYPQNVPLPRIGETVIIEDLYRRRGAGPVEEIRHVITEDVIEIRIILKPT
jgi:hypothetical protein